MKKLSISLGEIRNQYGLERAMEICKKNGFDAVDFGLENYKLNDEIYGGSEDAFLSHFNDVKKKAEDLELEIGQTHGRCATYYPDDEEQNKSINALCEKDLKATSVLNSPSCVIHFINNSRWGKQPADVMRSASEKMFNNIIPFSEENKVNIALETFGAARIKGDRIRDFFADPAEFKFQFDRMNTKYKTVCIDTGHIHEAESFWVPPADEFIRMMGKNISVLHLHDNTGHWDDHLLPGMGNINWPDIFEALDEIGYTGNYNFELRLNYNGCMLENFIEFAGKYLRKFVDNHGKL